MLAHVAVVNAPPVFRLVWGMVRRFLEPRTQSKIQARAGAGPGGTKAAEESRRLCARPPARHLPQRRVM